jgi:hypothetical protein
VTGFVLYVATPSGVAALSLDDPDHPAPAGLPLTFVGAPALGVAVSAGHVYVASGASGVFDLDMRTPAAPVIAGNLAAQLAPGQPINAVDVVVSKLPGQTWLLVLDASGDLWGLKLDNRVSVRERCFPDPRAAGCLLDLDFLDPTIMQRDPSFDPSTSTFDTADPSSASFFVQASAILASGKRLARPAVWEQLNTLTGRRLRDSFNPGSGTLSLGVMQVMRSVELCESAASSNNASGLNQLGYASGSICEPLGERRRPASACQVLATGRAVCRPHAPPPVLVPNPPPASAPGSQRVPTNQASSAVRASVVAPGFRPLPARPSANQVPSAARRAWAPAP